ncbi:MAG TPA: hypothetical protein VH300_01950 [Thermoleophilaceae bacterium]|nr:hypothetical protein [Thermoleophilaceae bacterium]
MAAPSRDEDVRTHITSISRRTHADNELLADALRSCSWPGGGEDRREPGALGWLRQWRPNGPAPTPAVCGCTSGRCLVCN